MSKAKSKHLHRQVCKRVWMKHGYLLQNTYTKLDYIQKYQDDPWRELRAVLYADDVTIAGLDFEDSRFNPKAVREIEDYIALRSHGTERIYAYEVVEHFNKRPFGWTDGEILLILGQLAVAGRITFDRGSSTAMERSLPCIGKQPSAS